jgi:hypothetical protein
LLLPTAVGTEVSTERVIQLQPARRYRPVRTADSTPACTRSTSVARRGTVIDPPAVPIKKRMENNLSIILIGGHFKTNVSTVDLDDYPNGGACSGFLQVRLLYPFVSWVLCEPEFTS